MPAALDNFHTLGSLRIDSEMWIYMQNVHGDHLENRRRVRGKEKLSCHWRFKPAQWRVLKLR